MGRAGNSAASEGGARRRPDIVLFGSFPEAGGICRRLANTVPAWVERGHGVEVVVFRGGRLFYPGDIGHLVSFHDLGTRTKLRSAAALWRYLVSRRPRALLTTTHTSNLVAAWTARLPGVRTRCVLSVGNQYARSEDFQPAQRSRKHREVRRYYPLAHAVVAVSDSVRRELTEGIGLRGVEVVTIYNASASPLLRRKAAEPVAHPWLSAKAAPVVVSAGRLAHQKDYPTLLRAFARLLQRVDARLIVLGEGRLRPELEGLVSALGIGERVDLHGYVANPYPFVAAADVFVLSSRWEGFPNALGEALYLGRQVVATDCPGGSREILADGRYGRLVAVGDVEGLAAAMAEAIRGPWLVFDPDEACARFMPEQVAEAYLRVFGLTPRPALR
jgi:glycosyltransferase involved in cell wall biosynthesis